MSLMIENPAGLTALMAELVIRFPGRSDRQASFLEGILLEIASTDPKIDGALSRVASAMAKTRGG